MVELYNNILAALNTIPELKWIDLDKNQMMQPRPTVVFPAALIKLSTPNRANVLKTIQEVQAQVIIKLCFEFTGSTAKATNEQARTKSLEYLNISTKIWKALQGFQTENMNSLECVSIVEEERVDDYKVLVQVYNTSFREDKS